jgi:hypothetical protein
VSKSYPHNALAQAKDTLAACKQIDPHLLAGRLTQEEFAQEIAGAEEVQAEIQDLELRLVNLRTRRDERITRVWDVTKRTRSGVKSTYGDDSTEYKLVGGTRTSERKRAARKDKEPVVA